jgi:hypothetical protein
MLEKQVEKYLTKRVKENNGLSYKWISSVTGVPDRIVFLNEKAFLVELKTSTGVLSPRQMYVFDELGEAGFPVYVLRSYDDIEEFIREATAP